MKNTEEQFYEIAKLTEGMSKSANNVVIFNDVPLLWLQYYLGLVFQRPTIIVLETKDIAWKNFFKRDPLVKEIFVIEKYDKDTAEMLAAKIAVFVKQNKLL